MSERAFYVIERTSDGRFWVGTGSHLKWTPYLHRARLFGPGETEVMQAQLSVAQKCSGCQLNIREFRYKVEGA